MRPSVGNQESVCLCAGNSVGSNSSEMAQSAVNARCTIGKNISLDKGPCTDFLIKWFCGWIEFGNHWL
jgi:hypothetical protein